MLHADGAPGTIHQAPREDIVFRVSASLDDIVRVKRLAARRRQQMVTRSFQTRARLPPTRGTPDLQPGLQFLARLRHGCAGRAPSLPSRARERSGEWARGG